MGLQSGFVFAVIVAAVLAAGHLGGPEELGKRLFQLALAVAVAFAVISATEAFIRNPAYEDAGSALESSFEDEESYEAIEDIADRGALRRMIQFAGGVVALVIGLSFIRRYPVTALALTLAGTLLVLFGGTVRDGGESNGLDSYYAAFVGILSSIIGQPSRMVDISEFIMLTAGAAALAIIGLRTWDMERTPQSAAQTPPPSTL